MDLFYTCCSCLCLWGFVALQSPPIKPSPRTPPVYSRGLETDLRKELFETGNYSVLQRPKQKVDVQVSFTLLTVNALNIKEQYLSVSGYLSVEWDDDRLSWENTSSRSQDYSSVMFLFSSEENVWTPAIIIENSVDDMSIISDTKIPMRINGNGKVHWNPSGIFNVACESDTTYYPFDTQTCDIKVSTWGYTQGEIQLVLSKKQHLDTTFYSENGEWDLIKADGYKSNDKSRGDQKYSSLSFRLTLRRKPGFHIINMICPMVLMAFLIPMVYKLPSDGGEKMGYCLTVLLAYAVYLTLISDSIPTTSKNICFLSIYLELILAYSTFSVTIVSIILNTNAQGEKKVPNWMNSLCCNHRRQRIADKFDVPIPDGRCNGDWKTHLEDFSSSSGSTKKTEGISYRQFSKMLDKFFFVVYISLVTITTVVLLFVLLLHFYSGQESVL